MSRPARRARFLSRPSDSVLLGGNMLLAGAANVRDGLLAEARGGTLFLDEVGELSIEQQGVLLRLMNQKRYRPMGQDAEVTTDAAFVLATLRDLDAMVDDGLFRIDFLKRISMFSYTLPGLAERPEDFDALIDFQLDVLERALGLPVTFDADAREAYLTLCRSPLATWPGNLRDLAYSLERMASNEAHRVDMAEVEAEAEVLMRDWTRERRGTGLPPAAAAPVRTPAGRCQCVHRWTTRRRRRPSCRRWCAASSGARSARRCWSTCGRAGCTRTSATRRRPSGTRSGT